MRMLLVTIVMLASSPALAESPPSRWEASRSRVALGYGEDKIDGPVRADLAHYTLGLRITKSDWAMVSYGRTEQLPIDEALDDELWEVFAGLGRMYCDSRFCIAGTGSGGYQRASWLFIDPITTPSRVDEQQRSAFAEARLALRLDFEYVWIEGAFALRTHVSIDDDSWELGHAFGLAAYIAL